jgi:hypothetical protein
MFENARARRRAHRNARSGWFATFKYLVLILWYWNENVLIWPILILEKMPIILSCDYNISPMCCCRARLHLTDLPAYRVGITSTYKTRRLNAAVYWLTDSTQQCIDSQVSHIDYQVEGSVTRHHAAKTLLYWLTPTDIYSHRQILTHDTLRFFYWFTDDIREFFHRSGEWAPFHSTCWQLKVSR